MYPESPNSYAAFLLIFKMIYNTEYRAEKDNTKLFCVIYLLHHKGIEISDYNFIWLSNGVYSSELSNDIVELDRNMEYYKTVKPVLSVDAKQAISEIKKIINTPTDYDPNTWARVLMMTHYLKSYVLSQGKPKDVANKLCSKSLLYNKTDENIKAYRLVSNI